MCTREPRLVLVSLLIGWKNGARTLNQSLNEVIIDQSNYLITFDTQLKTTLLVGRKLLKWRTGMETVNPGRWNENMLLFLVLTLWPCAKISALFSHSRHKNLGCDHRIWELFKDSTFLFAMITYNESDLIKKTQKIVKKARKPIKKL